MIEKKKKKEKHTLEHDHRSPQSPHIYSSATPPSHYSVLPILQVLARDSALIGTQSTLVIVPSFRVCVECFGGSD